jgi:hypothetical protein
VRLLDGDPAVERLVELARRNLDGRLVDASDDGFASLEDRMLARKRARMAKRMGAIALAAAVPLGVLGFQRLHGSPPALSYKVVNGTSSEGSRVLGGADTHIQFSDGSEVSLEPGTQTRIEDLKDNGGRVDLEDGQAHVSIVKQAKTAWLVEAGPYEVRVTGTRFDVHWSSRDQVFELTMEHGSVVVTGPGARDGVTLGAGQHAIGGVTDGRFLVESQPRPAAARTALGEAISAPPPGDPSANAGERNTPDGAPSAAETTAAAPVRGEGAREHAWRRLVALGNFRAVLDQAEQRGLDRTLNTAPLDALSALADAARYSRRADVARRTLLAERQRFAGSASAREAAFFIGRIEEDAQGSAMEWYERYLAESPSGPYASQALGRKMMLVYSQTGGAAASPIAQDYLARYPRGPYASAARKILDVAPGAHP